MANRFTINSDNQSFTDRQRNLFDQLETAEKNVKNTFRNQHNMEVDEPINTNLTYRNQPNEDKQTTRSRNQQMKQYKSRESIFKRPEAPITRCLRHGRIPDFRKNPNKWTKYSLDDVNDEDMSDKSNTQTALAFLKDLEKARGDEEEDQIDVLPEKVVFKKSAIAKKKNDISSESNNIEDKATFRSSKLIMPEYIVGQAVKKESRKKKTIGVRGETSTKKTQLKLEHLNDYDDEES